MNKTFLGLLSLVAMVMTAGTALAQSSAYPTPYSTADRSDEPSLGQRLGEIGASIFGKRNDSTSPPSSSAPARKPASRPQTNRSGQAGPPDRSDDEVVLIDGEPVRRTRKSSPASPPTARETQGVPYASPSPRTAAAPSERSVYMRQSARDDEVDLSTHPRQMSAGQREVLGAWVEEPAATENSNLEEILYGRRPSSAATGPEPPAARSPAAPPSPSSTVAARPTDGATANPTRRKLSADESPDAGFASAESLASPASALSATSTASPTQTANPVERPIHERLRALQRPAFNPPVAASTPAPAQETAPSAEPTPPASVAASPSQPTPVAQPTLAAPPASEPVPHAKPEAVTREPTVAQAPPTVHQAPPTVAQTPAAEPAASQAEAKTATSQPAPEAPAAATAAKPTKAAPARPEGRVLFSRQSPILGVETLGPRQIVVGKESTYEFKLGNAGEVGATDVVVYVDLPPWAEVASASATAGEAQAEPGLNGTQVVSWKVGQVEARKQERLELQIIPRESKPFDLAVRWDFKPMSSQASIEVQEPRLELEIDGPREVLFGHSEVFKLKLANKGSGAAENVVLSLLPLGTGQNTPVTHNLGTVPAGSQRVIEIELTARQAGDLRIQVAAQGEGVAHAELSETVFVRRAELQLGVEGPRFQYVGTVGNYHVELVNAGSAAAENVVVTARLPAGARYISGIEGAQYDAEKSELQWPVSNLEPGARRTYDMRCTFTAAGNGRMEIVSNGTDGVTAQAETVTQVEAMADLSMEVIDPSGPVPVGEEAMYELRVHNRGTKSAQGIEVVVYFSHGIEPTKVDGSPHKMGPGQVVFNPIASLDAGESLTLKVSARAETSGNHIFRAEVYCRPLGSRLVSEETTHFYSAEPVTAAPALDQPQGGPYAAPGYSSPRTATRPFSGSPHPLGGPTPAALPAAISEPSRATSR